MKVLVTGASGFVGSAVLRQLIEAGETTRALMRPTSDRRNLVGLPVEIVEGDLNRPTTLGAAVAGCDALYHVAADYRIWTKNPGELYQTNLEGTKNLMRAAAEAGVGRIVYTSSVATLGINKDGTPSDEETPVTLDDMIGHYKRSKFLAEQAVRQMIEGQGLPAIIVNPSAPVGPRDIKPTPTGRTILDAAAGRMPAYVDTGLNVVHVDDVAAGHLLAFQKGQIGQRYILGGHNLTLQQILVKIATLTGGKPPGIKLPHNLIMPIAYASEFWAKLSNGKEPRATVDGLRMAKKKMFFTSQKAADELGYEYQSAENALRDAIDWFRDHGYLNGATN